MEVQEKKRKREGGLKKYWKYSKFFLLRGTQMG
jgi:hypothetical protein